MKTTSKDIRNRRGWSLIEMVGVMGIIAIIALAVAPALLQQSIDIFRRNEARMLEQMAEGLKRSIIRNHYIPSHSDVFSVIASELGLEEAKVRFNRVNRERVYLIDYGLKIGPGSGATLPYAQTWQGSTLEPVNPRVLLISSLSEPLPLDIQSGVAQSQQAFDAIWDTGENQVPTGWIWAGQGEDLKIQRLHLGPLFICVALNNNFTSGGKFAVDNEASLHSMNPGTDNFAAYYIIGTRLRLCGSDGTLQTTEVVRDPCMFIFENGVWRGRSSFLADSRRLGGADLQAAYELFIASPYNTNNANKSVQTKTMGKISPVTQAAVTQSMINYLVGYIAWAAAGFPADNNVLKNLQNMATDMGALTAAYIDIK
jgi:type II secretory pathway pseudopilin PulG